MIEAVSDQPQSSNEDGRLRGAYFIHCSNILRFRRWCSAHGQILSLIDSFQECGGLVFESVQESLIE